MAGSSGISTTSLARGRGGGLSWRGAAPDVTGEVVLQEKALARIAVPKVPLIKVRPCSIPWFQGTVRKASLATSSSVVT